MRLAAGCWRNTSPRMSVDRRALRRAVRMQQPCDDTGRGPFDMSEGMLRTPAPIIEQMTSATGRRRVSLPLTRRCAACGLQFFVCLLSAPQRRGGSDDPRALDPNQARMLGWWPFSAITSTARRVRFSLPSSPHDDPLWRHDQFARRAYRDLVRQEAGFAALPPGGTRLVTGCTTRSAASCVPIVSF